MRTQAVDVLIIGAGMAGTVLARFLRRDRVVVLDPRPGSYKVGESIVPEHFHHPVLRALLPAIRALPSYTPKWGSTFVSGDSVASFPLPPHGAEVAMHVARQELEPLMHRAWSTPITREAAREVDIQARVVRTATTEYRVQELIVDCSGPSMFVAGQLGMVEPLWPVSARWAYFDITDIRDDLWRDVLRQRGASYRRYDIPKGVLLPEQELEGWRPSHTTTLTRVDAARWIWQIPLFGRTRLSVGLVNRGPEPVSTEELFELAQQHAAPHYTLRPRPTDGASPYDRVHTRRGFARKARVPATLDYVLLADACAFADPIYSVGTGLAVNKAIELAALLNEEGWTPATLARWSADYEALITRAVAAFESWYDGSLLESDGAAREVQQSFLVGSAFQVGIAHRYSQQIVDAGPPLDQPAPEGRGRHVVDAEARPQTPEVSALLGVAQGEALAGWIFDGAYATQSETQLRFHRAGRPPLVVNVSFDIEETRYYRRVGDLSLSFMNLFESPYPLEADGVALFDALEASIARDLAGWRALRPG